jgi:hypothetical protein
MRLKESVPEVTGKGGDYEGRGHALYRQAELFKICFSNVYYNSKHK